MNETKGISALGWVGILGAVGFVTGFFGPLIFAPEANQGPLVGILISGPAGVALGFVLFVACKLLNLSAQSQWRLLSGVALLGGVVVLLGIQPPPALRGTLYDSEVKACRSPREAEAETVQYWNERIAQVTWAEPRSGWQQDVHETLERAPGILVSAEITRKNSVFENRKPWNRGSIFVSGWKTTSELKSVYYSTGSCVDFPVGGNVRGFEKYDLGGKIEPPKDWPPKDFEGVINASIFSTVPEPFKTF